MADIRLKRAYEKPSPDDGLRILVELKKFLER